MINQYNPDTHVGEQPIRVLQHNMTSWLHDTSAEFRKISIELAGQKKLNPGIAYKIGCDTINSKDSNGNTNTPYILGGTIQLHETFLSYLWCVSYSIIRTHLVLIKNETIRGVIGDEIFKKDPQVYTSLQKVIDVFGYGISLFNEYTKWDLAKIPNPESFEEVDKDFIGNVNAVYLSAISFILCHEVAHAYLNHSERKIEQYRRTRKIDSLFQKTLEQEADNQAVQWMISDCDNGDLLYTRKIGIIVGACSLLFMSKSVNSNTHPDTDSRIKYITESCIPGDNSELWALACIAFNLWDNMYKIGLEWENDINQTYQQLFEEILNQ